MEQMDEVTANVHVLQRESSSSSDSKSAQTKVLQQPLKNVIAMSSDSPLVYPKNFEPLYNLFNSSRNQFSPQSQNNVQSQHCSKLYCPRKRIAGHDRRVLRLRPYNWVRTRSRTRSENADSSSLAHCETMRIIDKVVSNAIDASMMDTSDQLSTAMDTSMNTNLNSAGSFRELYNESVLVTNVQILKKSKSLEDIRSENLDGSQPSHEMEFVSSRIQKLKVQE